MRELTITLSLACVSALEQAVAEGEVATIEEGALAALEAWLFERLMARATDSRLQALWREGVDSGAASALDLNALKAEARRALSGD